MPDAPNSLPVNDRLSRLREILQDEISPATLEKLAAALLSKMLGISVAVAKSGFQHGGDGGTSGREGRRLRIETKRYADGTAFSTRELVGEIEDALARDPALEAWILVATREAAEQIEQSLLHKGEVVGIPVLIVDWKAAGFPGLAALCTSAPEIVETFVSAEAAAISAALMSDAAPARGALIRELEAWQLSRDSSLGQRTDGSFTIQGGDCVVDCVIEGVYIDEGLVSEMMGFEVTPDQLDIVEFRGVFGQPLDGEPVLAGLDCSARELADVDRPIVLDQHDRGRHPSRLRAIQPIRWSSQRKLPRIAPCSPSAPMAPKLML